MNQEHHVQYCSSNSVVVVSAAGRLKQIYTPFPVWGKALKEGKRVIYIVEEIASTKDDKLVYLIAGKAYYHHYFYIDIRF